MKNKVVNNKLGIITLALSLTYIFLGLPSQIAQIWQTHSIKNVSILLFIFLGVQCFFWVLYGIQRKDKILIITNSFLTCFAFIVVIEWFMFR
jgi:uncharacterized protein with PQ loop repeat